jgi:hypothetical protein
MKDSDWNVGIMVHCVKIDQILFVEVLFLSHHSRIPIFQTKTAYPPVLKRAKSCSAVRRKNFAEQDRPFLQERAANLMN